ncbi:bifunctional 4-hydroxy-2-oxoglutarate aldolase/2-dehydro-3-deoxy-phosphogluconate aldolase [Ruminococcaceae bacterium OttesenSCG-928-D13]|nr:bifunctional 4-hydroxy-2-oxoglutarate aldolase/2-dehydro-3-deoxy-phosphogluconate aldolase [Ruminococcaceae bacterium OttesenSCG-928-D13]
MSRTSNVFEIIGKTGILPTVVIDEAESAVSAAQALLAGGVGVMEFTLRTPAGLVAIANVADACPGMLVGAGTVLTLEQCRQSVEAGAQFIVSPGLDEAVVAFCMENDVAVLPGCVTPTEISRAIALGLHHLKYFPAQVYGGLKGMAALAGPFGGIRFVPTGGIDSDNLAEYAAAPFVFAAGGSWLCSRKAIREKNFDEITRLTVQAASVWREAARTREGRES